jgi:hypothetical protein
MNFNVKRPGHEAAKVLSNRFYPVLSAFASLRLGVKNQN